MSEPRRPAPDAFKLNFFMTPNAFVDFLMPLLTDSEWKTLSYAVRLILGWKDTRLDCQTEISFLDFVKGCDRAPQGTAQSLDVVFKNCKNLHKFGILVKVNQPKGVEKQLYRLEDDPAKMDFEGLNARFKKKKIVDQHRTEKARAKKLEFCRTEHRHSVGQNTNGNTPYMFKERNKEEEDQRVFSNFNAEQTELIQKQWVEATGAPITPTHIKTIQKSTFSFEDLTALLEYVAFNAQTIPNRNAYILKCLKGEPNGNAHNGTTATPTRGNETSSNVSSRKRNGAPKKTDGSGKVLSGRDRADEGRLLRQARRKQEIDGQLERLRERDIQAGL